MIFDYGLARIGVLDEYCNMLKRLKVERFKSLKEVSLELADINLFIGGNGSGKSSLLEAIGLASACLGRGLGDSDIGAKGLRLTPPTLMKSSFKNEKLPRTLTLETAFEGDVTYRAALHSRDGDPLLRFSSEAAEHEGERVFGRSPRGVRIGGEQYPADRVEAHRGLWDQLSLGFDPPAEMVEVFEAFERYVIYTPQTDVLRGRRSGDVDMLPVGLSGQGLSSAARSFLRRLRSARLRNQSDPDKMTPDQKILVQCADLVWLPGWASSFGVRRADTRFTSTDIAERAGDIVYLTDRFMHASRNRLSVYDSSEGTLFLLFAAIILAHPDAPRVFALDNVDNALNPRLTRRLVEQIINVTRLSREEGATLGAKQVFLTSHNPTALDAFDLFDDRQRVFVVSRNEKGHTVATRLKPPEGQTREGWAIASGGRNLSQLWLDRKIPGALGVEPED